MAQFSTEMNCLSSLQSVLTRASNPTSPPPAALAQEGTSLLNPEQPPEDSTAISLPAAPPVSTHWLVSPLQALILFFFLLGVQKGLLKTWPQPPLLPPHLARLWCWDSAAALASWWFEMSMASLPPRMPGWAPASPRAKRIPPAEPAQHRGGGGSGWEKLSLLL